MKIKLGLARILAQIRGILVKIHVYVKTRIPYTFSHFVCHRSRHHYVKWDVLFHLYLQLAWEFSRKFISGVHSYGQGIL
jgi:hypothetical protein